MQRGSLLAPASAFLALALVHFPGAVQAFEISSAVVHGNLAVYFVRGTGQNGPAPLTLDQAVAKGAIRIYDDRPLAIENVSGQSVFLQLGDLLKGGLQDQVVATSFILPPRSGRVALDTFCVDPFRSAARDGEKPNRFASVGQLPSRAAKLSMVAGSSESKTIRDIRQSGIWWSIDSLRSQLADRLGVPMEPPRAAHWAVSDSQNERANAVLAARRSFWSTSLPLALENRRLAQAQQAYMDAFKAKGERGGDIIGAVFAINGRAEGAEIYQSQTLFRQAWPKLLRAYATEAIASNGSVAEVLPTPQAVNAFLTAAEQGQARDRASGSDLLLRDSAIAISAETVGRNGHWIHRGYLPKLDLAAAALTPEATVVKILETGRVAGRSIKSLGEKERVILQRNPSGDRWTATIPGQGPLLELEARVTEQLGLLSGDQRSRLALALIAAALLVLLFHFFVRRLAGHKAQNLAAMLTHPCRRAVERLGRFAIKSRASLLAGGAPRFGPAPVGLRSVLIYSATPRVQGKRQSKAI
jgi:hypothetical protein